jgi:hypothetical protein
MGQVKIEALKTFGRAIEQAKYIRLESGACVYFDESVMDGRYLIKIRPYNSVYM